MKINPVIESGKIMLIIVTVIAFAACPCAFSQLSPGELTKAHSNLEGMSNCTKCHTLGSKVSNNKCLECHVELKSRIAAQKGYHSSSQIRGKECASCHSDHHGLNFRIVNFEATSFDHSLTGFNLTGAHLKEECKNCHKPDFILDSDIRKKTFTYLGLNTECLSCHEDYHKKTLSSTCTNCHGIDSFKPAVKFDHQKTKYPLVGKHQQVECARCHKIETVEGKKYQAFAGLHYDNCTGCHLDQHQGKFGQNCRECHSEESFHSVAGMNDFDHNKTNFPLVDKHVTVNCKSCHKGSFTDPLKHTRCSDCHIDYHRSQFAKEGVSPDCSSCHSTRGFTGSSFTILQHNEGRFPLAGAHLATPCFECHKKTEKWEFRDIGIHCADCHKDIHEPAIDQRHYPEKDCRRCHTMNRWDEVTFNHSATKFELTGAHVNQNCRQCHFKTDAAGVTVQKFTGLPTNCNDCHKDVHYSQFATDGATRCDRCHETMNWKASKFNHDSTRFPLDGRHINVACNKCHKVIQQDQVSYTQYKIKEFKCENCHH
jgi:hypothetical protein